MKNEAKEAWADYSGDYNKRMKKAVSDFKAEKEKFLKMYSDMVDMQREALATRRRIARIAEADENSFSMEFIPCRSGINTAGLLRLGGFACMDADAAYYLAHHCEKNNKNLVGGGYPDRDREEARISCVVVSHNPEIIV